MAKYATPRVPQETLMFEPGPDGRPILTRTWMIFFERLFRTETSVVEIAGQRGPFIRTLLIKDSTIGDDIADHVPAFVAGKGVRLLAVRRAEIEDDLTVRVNKNGDPFITLTLPAATPLYDVVEGTAFVTDESIGDLVVFSWDITASSEETDVNGIASFTLCWTTEENVEA